jgi:hypothetical protein
MALLKDYSMEYERYAMLRDNLIYNEVFRRQD